MSKTRDIFKKVLKSVAPMVATAVGGPFGGLAATVLKDAFETDDVAAIEAQIASADPDALVKLKIAEAEMSLRMRELDIDEADLYLKDTQDARGLAKVTGVVPQLILTGVAMLAFGAVLYVLVLQSQVIPPENKDLVIFLVGQLSIFVGMGYSFFLGTTKSSAEKNKIIQQQANSK